MFLVTSRASFVRMQAAVSARPWRAEVTALEGEELLLELGDDALVEGLDQPVGLNLHWPSHLADEWRAAEQVARQLRDEGVACIIYDEASQIFHGQHDALCIDTPADAGLRQPNHLEVGLALKCVYPDIPTVSVAVEQIFGQRAKVGLYEPLRKRLSDLPRLLEKGDVHDSVLVANMDEAHGLIHKQALATGEVVYELDSWGEQTVDNFRQLVQEKTQPVFAALFGDLRKPDYSLFVRRQFVGFDPNREPLDVYVQGNAAGPSAALGKFTRESSHLAPLAFTPSS